MDLVYLVGTGSTWMDNELRYSLRSAEQNFQHGKVFVVGYQPPWVSGAVHLPVADLSANKVINQLNKLSAVVKDNRLSESFLLMNDDFLFTKKVARPATYVHRTLRQSIASQHGAALYSEMDQAALDLLTARGIDDPISFETHTPLPMEKGNVRSMLHEHGYGGGRAYHFRSVYGNLFHTDPVICDDPKVRIWSGRPPDLPVMSIGDDITHDHLLQSWLARQWPSPCRYECA